MARLKVYVCTDHDYHYPVGCASVAIAYAEDEARAMLDEQLIAHGLKPFEHKPYTLRQISGPVAEVLVDGDY